MTDLSNFEIRFLYKKFPPEIKDEFHLLITNENLFEKYPNFRYEQTQEQLISSLEIYSTIKDEDLTKIMLSAGKRDSEENYNRVLLKRMNEVLAEYLRIKETLLDEYPEWLI